MRRSVLFASFIALSLTGCNGDDGGGGGGGDGADANPNAADADPNAPDGGGTDGTFSTLLSASWTLQPGQSDRYRCASLTVTEDIYINGFRALSPAGTHHTVLSVTPDKMREDGEWDCNASELEHSMLFASGVGTDDLLFPEGVAMRVPAGSQLHLNLHLYNVSDQAISGTSGTLGKLIPASELVTEAEVVFAGTYSIALNSSTAPQTVKGGCALQQDATVVALWPHMHQLGTHLKVVHKVGATENILHDKPFDFEEQLNYVLSPTEVKAGERIEVTCTYVNTTGAPVFFGDSSDREMCFAGIYRYPATGAGLFSCVGN